MKVLVGCEYSATVARAFRDRGHDVMTCDLEPTEDRSIPHFQGDVFEAVWKTWDLIILHPPCTALCVAGNRHYSGTQHRDAAIDWTINLWEYAVNHSRYVALENPVGVLSSAWRKPSQYIQPWQFGHMETKKTGLWLHNLPPLKPTNNVYDEMMKLPMKDRHRVWYASPGKDRGKERARFYAGIAEAMAEKWGDYDE